MIGADVLALSLKKHGIEYVLGIPGHESVVLRSFKEYGLKFITTRHEQAAAFAADGAGRITRCPAIICYSTFGPGATNLLTGVASAFSERSPLIAFCPQVKKENYHPSEGHQSLDLVSIFKPVTKYAVQIDKVEALSKEVAIAYKIACEERQGPVFITAFLDVLEASADSLEIIEPLTKSLLPLPTEEEMAPVLQLINGSEKPLLVIGGVINRLNIHKELKDFVARSNIPVIATFHGKSSLPEYIKNYLGVISSHEWGAFGSVFEQSDLILFIGHDFAEGKIHKCWQKGTKKQVISINTTKNLLFHICNFDIEVVGDIGKILSWFAVNYKSKVSSQYLDFCCSFHRRRIKYLIKPTTKLNDAKNYFIEIRKHLREEDILVLDVGIHKHLGGLILERNAPNSILFSNGLSSAGFGFPASIGAKMFSPNKELFCISGDGGFLMNIQELETIIREKIKINIILFEDKEYGLIRQYQEISYDFNYGTKFDNPDFKKICDAFGLDYYKIRSIDDIGPSMELARSNENSSIIHIKAHYDYSKLL